MNKRPTKKQLLKLKMIWFIYGNDGKKSTNGNHKMIQRLIEQNRDSMDIIEESVQLYGDNITFECFYEVFKVLIGKEDDK